MPTKPDRSDTTPRLGRYDIDASRSTVTFRTRHLFGLAPVRGTFAVATGTVDIAEPITDSGVRAEIETASFRTGNRQRDAVVRSARFLAADRHPVMTFVSERLDGQTLAGTLTVCGVSRPVSLSVEQADVSAQSFTARASVRIDRTEFGVTASRGLAGRFLDVAAEIVCVRT